ncbi:hypothetical protein R3W88_023827 [Solanum pinnatisectum]|uniref:NADH:quinone oxidoreductase/Mrp antiporter membrane subunit domain-containing protein n=1 Tax=Solanum pinnatisectum TaxID=50273 RepID=A0AAV9LYM7_9SOLN|nr:hypothetical protein R3W88_023827 [Solanum pinnatisectum]
MAITEFLLFVLTTTLGGMFLCGANDLITIFVAPECFNIRSNEATMKYLLMGGASSSILVHGFSWLYAPSHQWTPDVYEGVRFVREIPTSLSISEMFGFFKTPWTCRREILSPLGPRQNLYLFK